MPILSSRKLSLTMSLLAGATALTLSALPVLAQDDYDQDDTAYTNDSGEIEVYAPRYNSERTPLNAPIQKVSLSTTVHYDDLNLADRRDARELKVRVEAAAQDVCEQLADAYPVKQAPGTSCYKTALNDGLVKANRAIDHARVYARYSRND